MQDVIRLARVQGLRASADIVETLFNATPEEREHAQKLDCAELRQLRCIAINTGCYDADDYLRYYCAAPDVRAA
jgi:hypothetical protein